jgi:hypothetical protein
VITEPFVHLPDCHDVERKLRGRNAHDATALELLIYEFEPMESVARCNRFRELLREALEDAVTHKGDVR